MKGIKTAGIALLSILLLLTSCKEQGVNYQQVSGEPIITWNGVQYHLKLVESGPSIHSEVSQPMLWFEMKTEELDNMVRFSEENFKMTSNARSAMPSIVFLENRGFSDYNRLLIGFSVKKGFGPEVFLQIVDATSENTSNKIPFNI